ncbi:SEC14-like protein 2 [Folsomia candida]|uniref:SEC14-like protein 2 n=1 Tax=Folsomia candida TaxID=158441 RepID=UPI000B902EED|nr:SEC14-like protein 2 [Folsomia candida]
MVVVLVVIFICASACVPSSQGTLADEDLTLTFDQKVKLDEFKAIITPRVPHEYMKSEVYLLPWLRVNNFNVDAATKEIVMNFNWRDENKIDSIFEDDWTQFNKDYRISVEGCDAEGKPVLSLFVGEWNLRRAVVSGQSDKMYRFIDKLYEEAGFVMRNMQKSGNNITRVQFLSEFSGVSVQQQLCPRCISFFIRILEGAGRNPLIFTKLIFLNIPQYAVSVWNNIVAPITPPSVASLIELHGTNKEAWRDILLKTHGIDVSKLSPDFGGDGPDSVDLETIRRNGYNYECPN